MQTFSLIFLAALSLATLVKLWLGLRQLRHVAAHRERVPAEFAGEITPEAHAKAADYSNTKTKLGLFSILFECVVVLVLISRDRRRIRLHRPAMLGRPFQASN